MKKPKVPEIQVDKDQNGEWFFHLRAPNGEIQAHGEGYSSKSKALRGATSFKKNATAADIVVVAK